MLKVDAFTHIWPPEYYEALTAAAGAMTGIARRSESMPMMVDLDERFSIMDLHDEYAQILSLGSPPLELVADKRRSVDLAKIGTDSQAELCRKYPDRFKGFVSTLPLAAGAEAFMDAAKYAVEDAGACGIQVYTHVEGRPLDAPEFVPLWDYMAEVDLPVWLHPARGAGFADYESEGKSKYEIWWTFGWPYESSAAMARLVFSKTMQRLPNLKVITHHGGGMIPFFEGRVGPGWDALGARSSDEDYAELLESLELRPIDYFRRFVADTATFGSAGSIELARRFFGDENVVFASDAPFDPEGGRMYIRETIKAIDGMDAGEDVMAAIYHGNLERLTKRKFS